MSILIKGMETPKNFDSCMFSRRSIHNIDWCVLTKKDLPCDCPIVPVPPHGRLIDADALLELIGFEVRHYVVKDDFDKGRVAAWNNVIHVIREYAPTIIPAEEDE